MPDAAALMGNPGNTPVVCPVKKPGVLTCKPTIVLNENNATVEPTKMGAHDRCLCVPHTINLLLTDTPALLNSECTTPEPMGNDGNCIVIPTNSPKVIGNPLTNVEEYVCPWESPDVGRVL